ncbi:MAG: hypothetical protein CM15mP22_7920 [Gammaproteobacteria bacterium]|nr:MAG: hypothetical protein CM15mP22_7920 [Gammaproteobacteria bacterium]
MILNQDYNFTDEIKNPLKGSHSRESGRFNAVDQYRLQNNQNLIDTLNRLNEVSRELEIIKEEFHKRLTMKFIMNEIFFKNFFLAFCLIPAIINRKIFFCYFP